MRYIVHVNVFLTITLDFRYFFLVIISVKAHAHNVYVGVQPLFLCAFKKKKSPRAPVRIM